MYILSSLNSQRSRPIGALDMGGGGGGPCRMSIIRNSNVALSNLRYPPVALSILRKPPVALSNDTLMSHVTKA